MTDRSVTGRKVARADYNALAAAVDDLENTPPGSVTSDTPALIAVGEDGSRADVPFVTPQMFGAVADNSTDDYQAFREALDYLASESPSGDATFPANGTLFVPAGRYYLSQPLSLKSTVRIKGESGGQAGGRATTLRFPSGSAGIIVNNQHSDGYEDDLNTTSADGSIIEGLALIGGAETGKGGGASYDDAAEADGILLRGRATIRDCQIYYFQRDGISIQAATDGIPLLGNANLWIIERCRSALNGRHGLYVVGADANAGVCTMLDASYNARWGILDTSFLGNSYIACHADGNGIGDGVSLVDSIVSHPAAGQRYAIVYGQEANADTEPGTDDTVWVEAGDSTGGREWTSEIVVRSGGPFAIRSNSQLIGCYSEGGQGPSQNVSPAISLGGLHGAGFAGSGIHLGGSFGDLTVPRGIVTGGSVDISGALAGLSIRSRDSGDRWQIYNTNEFLRFWLENNGDIAELTSAGLSVTGGYYCNGIKVIGSQGAAVTDASGGGTVDTEARAAINALLARCRAHGLIAT